MMLLETFVFYLFFASSLLIYGIGLKQLFITSDHLNEFFIQLLRSIFITEISIFLTRGISMLLFANACMQELYPFAAVIFTILVSMCADKLFNLIFHNKIKEFSLSLCFVILAVGEGLSMTHSLVIGIACICSFNVILPVLNAIRTRMKFSQQNIDFKSGALVFLSIAIIMLILFSLNISWFNFEVL